MRAWVSIVIACVAACGSVPAIPDGGFADGSEAGPDALLSSAMTKGWIVDTSMGLIRVSKDPATGALIPGLNPTAVVQLPNEYQEYAAFANGTYKFTDAFHLTAGVRYARNEQDFRQISFGVVVPPALTGTVSFNANGLGFPAVAAWLQRIAAMPSFTDIWVPQASSADQGTREVVTFTSTGTITDAARSDRLEQLTQEGDE